MKIEFLHNEIKTTVTIGNVLEYQTDKDYRVFSDYPIFKRFLEHIGINLKKKILSPETIISEIPDMDSPELVEKRKSIRQSVLDKLFKDLEEK